MAFVEKRGDLQLLMEGKLLSKVSEAYRITAEEKTQRLINLVEKFNALSESQQIANGWRETWNFLKSLWETTHPGSDIRAKTKDKKKKK